MNKIILSLIISANFGGLFAQESKSYDFSLYEKKMQVEGKDTLRYRILMPEKMEQGKKYPLFIFFHGVGESGNDNESQLKNCAFRFLEPDARKNYPSIVIFPQMPARGRSGTPPSQPSRPAASRTLVEVDAADDASRLQRLNTPQVQMSLELVRDMVLKSQVDPDRVYIGGLSMGGMITYAILSTYPDWFAAAVPICGRSSRQSVASWANKVPVWLFVGDEDEPFIEYNRDVDKILTLLRVGHKYTEYPGVGHNSWDPAFNEPDLLPWIFSNVKKGNIESFKKSSK